MMARLRYLETLRLLWPLGLVLAGCSMGTQDGPHDTHEHPLIGQIWDARRGAFVDYGAVRQRAAGASHVLIGETHINPEHHRIQKKVITDLADEDAPIALVFEIFETGQQEAIDEAVAGPRPKAEALADATRIEESGWDWDEYRPLVQLALDRNMPVLAGNAPREEVRQVAFVGLDAVSPERQLALGLDVPLPPSADHALTQVIVASHCGHVQGDMAERLVDAQRVRDATMADVMLSAPSGKTVLIAGAGHVRRDYGVPRYLLEREPAMNVLSLGLVEVSPELVSPAEYLDRLENLDTSFDYLWFTERTVSEDPCEQFRESLETFRNHGQQG